MSKAKALRELSDDQLASELNQTQLELFQLRIRASTEKLDAPSSLRKLRRSIARMKTVQRQRELSNQ
ncbi:50S ribosomal protein L29 [Planctomicrobium sp. SH527]|uniref:50S ribosomal protein L29 n=1 Tax=Planctomicrobium sp. SH527 TaxID=3448123 RepID=UPI003F5BD9A5